MGEEGTPASDGDTLPGGPRAAEWGLPEKLGRHRVIDRIASGGMGIVLRAHDPELERDVALKVLRMDMGEEERARFLREARQAASLRHPNIVAVHEVGRAGGRDYFTMDLVEGESLADGLKRGKPTAAEAVRIMKEVVSAVAYAHSRGVIHRDLKPGNVMLDEEGRALVMDFGLAKSLEAESGMTQTGDFLGTPFYMSPEAASGDAPRIDERSDIYCLGVMLYEMLTGDVPFHHTNVHILLAMHLADDPEPPRGKDPSVPRDLETIALKCLEKEKERRYATAQAFFDDLQRFEKGEPILAHPPSVLYRLRKKVVRHKWVAVAAVLGVLLVGAGVVWFLSWKRAREELERERAALLEERQKELGEWVPVFEDDFEREELGPEWEPVLSGHSRGPQSWHVQDGSLAVNAKGEALLWLKRQFKKDLRIEFTGWCQPPDCYDLNWVLFGEPERGIGLGYFAGVGIRRNTVAVIACAGQDVVKDPAFRVEAGRKYRMAFEVRRRAVRFFVDGRLLLEWTDPRPGRERGARFAFETWDNRARFDDLRIYEHSPGTRIDPLDLAERYYHACSYELAAAMLEDLVRTRSGEDRERALLLSARVNEARGKLDEARRAYEELVRKGGKYSTNAAIRVAKLALAEGRLEIALDCLGVLTRAKAAGKAELNELTKGVESLPLAKRKRFEDNLTAACERGAFGVHGLFSAAEKLRAMGRFDESISAYVMAEEDRTSKRDLRARARQERGRTLHSAGELEEAIETFASVERDYPDQRGLCAWARQSRGLALQVMGRLEEALGVFASVERDFPDYRGDCVRSRRDRGLTLRAMGKLEDALKVLASVEQDYPEQRHYCPWARRERGRILHAIGRPEEALNVFLSLERDYPAERWHCAWTRLYRGLTLRAEGNLEEALKTFVSLDREYSGTDRCGRARIELGITHRARGRFDEALETLASVERDYPEQRWQCAEARVERAATLRAVGSLGEALEVLASVERDYPVQRGECARALLLAGATARDAQAGREFLRRAAEYRDRARYSAPARYLLGEIGEKEFARLMFDWLWRADVEYWKGEKALRPLGEARGRDGRKDDAVKHFSRAIELNVPGEALPLLEARLRLKELGAPVPPLPWEK